MMRRKAERCVKKCWRMERRAQKQASRNSQARALSVCRMLEIWWRDRLVDVVPAFAGEVPAGLTVRSRRCDRIERVRGEPRDWRFEKVLAMALLTFAAGVMVMRLTPVG